MPLCKHCGKAKAEPNNVGWLGLLPLLFGMLPPRSDQYCRDCATGMLVPSLLLLGVLLAVGFVVAVILWG